jgi:RNA polymerase sigma factor (sigma-70 family)
MCMPANKEIKTASAEDSARIGWGLLRQGEMKGLELVYNSMVDDMHGYGMGVYSNSAFVQDCIHEVFVSLWKYRFQLKQTEHIKAYLFRSLGNKIRREMGQDLSSFRSKRMEIAVTAGWQESVEQEWMRDQKEEHLNSKLARAVDRLPPRQKEAVELLFFQQLPYEEVSTAMNLHIRSVYTLIWKALSSLRKHMTSCLALIFGMIG